METVNDNKWMEKWEAVKEKTVCPVDLNTYFEQKEIAGKALAIMDIGACDLPSGKVLVRDPLVYLSDRSERPYLLTAPTGTYHTEICVVKSDGEDCDRYAAVRLCFSENELFASTKHWSEMKTLTHWKMEIILAFVSMLDWAVSVTRYFIAFIVIGMNNGAKIILMITPTMDILHLYLKRIITNIRNISAKEATG